MRICYSAHFFCTLSFVLLSCLSTKNIYAEFRLESDKDCYRYKVAFDTILSMSNIRDTHSVCVCDSTIDLPWFLPSNAFENLEMYNRVKKRNIDQVLYNLYKDACYSECLNSLSCYRGQPDYVLFFSKITEDNMLRAELFSDIEKWLTRFHPRHFLIQSHTNQLIYDDQFNNLYTNYGLIAHFNTAYSFLFVFNDDCEIIEIISDEITYE